ncbi:frizzled receptor [Chamberlinius hualienensis]
MLPVLIISLAALLSPSMAMGKKFSRCEEITIPMCRDIGYNLTSMPNQFNHDTQEEAGLEVHQFWPLVEIQCSTDLKFFLCSMYAPICMVDYTEPLPVCRSVCERAKAGCSPLMRHYGFAWPERMNCDKLPEFGDKIRLCMDFRNGSEYKKNQSQQKLPKINPNVIGVGGQKGNRGRYNTSGKGVVSSRKDKSGIVRTSLNGESIPKSCDCHCHQPLVQLTENNSFYNKLMTGGVLNCAISCDGPYFTGSEKTFAKYWIGISAILCFISTFVTAATFIVDGQRCNYPERPIMYIAGCYMMVSIGYLLPYFVGHENVACDGDAIRYDGIGSPYCVITFLLTYFFGMASAIWWIILALTWFLAAGLKWGHEAIAKRSKHYHCVAWPIPFLKSVVIIIMNVMDGDPTSGICYVGNQNVDHLRGFVITPLVVYLVTGSIFLLAGFVSLCRIHSAIKSQGQNKTDKLVKLMIKIGFFSLSYILPVAIVICCYFYEQHNRELWEISYNCECTEKHKPEIAVLIIKYFMSLSVGISSSVWIWSPKTLKSWKKFYAKLFKRNDDSQLDTSPNKDVRTCIKNPNMDNIIYPTIQSQTPLSHV